MAFRAKVYHLAIRKRQDAEDFFFDKEGYTFTVLDFHVPGRYWMADPFLFENDGVTYLFYELYDFTRRKGMIAYSVLHDDLTVTKPCIIINEGHHLSFPFIFRDDDGAIKIIPESCGAKRVETYTATDFPNKWVREKVLIQCIYSCDTVMLDDGGKRCLLTSVQSMDRKFPHVVSCYVKNVLFPMNGGADDGFGLMDGTATSEGDYGVRNAGAVFDYHGRKVRPGQDSRDGKYGQGVCFFAVNSDCSEELIKCVSCGDMQSHLKCSSGEQNAIELCGFHTYNSTARYEVIDVAMMENISSKYNAVYRIRVLKRALTRALHELSKAL